MNWRPMNEAPTNPAGKAYGPWLLVRRHKDGGLYQVRWQFDNFGTGYWKGIGANDFRQSELRSSHWVLAEDVDEAAQGHDDGSLAESILTADRRVLQSGPYVSMEAPVWDAIVEHARAIIYRDETE